jgi:polyphosphate kinase 2 (PPK2 family)
VNPFCKSKKRYRSIVDLEKHLHRNDTRIIKVFLHLSKDEQQKRFRERIDEPDKNWKFSLSDIHERNYWGALHEGIRGVPECNEHRQRALVCGPPQTTNRTPD